MNFSELKQHYVGKYIFLLKDEEKGYVWEIETIFMELHKATEGIGCVGFKFRERKRNNENKGIGFYKIVDMQKRGDDIFAYVDLITLITPKDHLPLYHKEMLLLDLLYSSQQTCSIDTAVWESLDKKDPAEYEEDVVLLNFMDIIHECNCFKLREYLRSNGYGDEKVPVPDRVIDLIESKGTTDGSVILNVISEPSKMMRYADYISNLYVFYNLKTDFPELYNKLDKQFDSYAYDFKNKLYDYFCRAHVKYKKYYGPSKEDISMEDEMKAVFRYEQVKKEHEKEEKKRKRKNKKLKGDK